jgi:hypothetical protein
MTLLKRLLTSAAFFLPLLVILYFGICMVGGAIAGARVGLESPKGEDINERSRQAGADFVRNNLSVIALSSLGGAAALSLAISFSGVLPWCRKPKQPPSLPPTAY